MKYGFIKFRSKDNICFYMEPKNFDRYDFSLDHDFSIDSLVIFDNIYIGCFPLVFKINEILDFNSEASIVDDIPFSDVCFSRCSFSDVAKIFGCVN